jgi:O-antigen ligase
VSALVRPRPIRVGAGHRRTGRQAAASPLAALPPGMRKAADLAFVVTASLVVAYVLVRRKPVDAFALLALPSLVWLLTRRDLGLFIGVTLILVLPSWLALGSAQLDVLRVASVVAALTILRARRRVTLSAVDGALLLLLVVTLLGWLIQDQQPHAGRILSVELTPLGFYIGARAATPSSIRKLGLTAFVAGTVGALTVIYEYFAGHTVFVNSLTYQWNATPTTIFRPGGIFGGPPQACTVLCFVLMLGVAAWRDLQGYQRLLGAAGIALCVGAITLTFTRAGLIAAGAGLVLYLWLTRSRLLRPVRVVWIAGVTIVLVIVLLPHLYESSTINEGVLRAGTLTARLGYWSTAAPIATASPHNFLFGVGTATLETPALSPTAHIPAVLAVRPQDFRISLHSQIVTELIENGLVGLASLALFVLLPFRRLARRARIDGNPHAAALAASIVAIVIMMSVNTILLDGPSFSVLLLCAAVASTAESPPDRLAPPSHRPSMTSTQRSAMTSGA